MVALQWDLAPEALLQRHQPALFEGQLSLQPAFNRRVIRATAQWLPLLALPFHGRRELGGPLRQQLLAAFTFPAMGSRLIKHLPLQSIGEVLLRHPVIGVGVGVAVAHPIPESRAITVRITQMLGHLLGFLLAQLFHRVKKAQGAVALAGAGQIQGGLHQGVKPLG